MSTTPPDTLPHTTATPPSEATPDDVLAFWLGDGLQRGWPTQDLSKKWFGGGSALDEDIKTRFEARVVQAVAGGLEDWEGTALSRLALIILLDQFTRNVFRGKAQAFAGDARSQQLVMNALEQGFDKQLPWVGRVFMYMPLMHAENLALQDECVKRFRQLALDAPEEFKPNLAGNADFAAQHRDIVARFGRFPYRNAVLGRASTPEEEEFLKNGPRFGQ
ncbi:MAG: DUF924 family protein [Pseudomonadota bacterium]